MVRAPGVWIFDVSHLERFTMRTLLGLLAGTVGVVAMFSSCGCAAKGNVSGSFGQERILSGSYTVVYDAHLEVPILDEIVAIVLPTSAPPVTPDP